MSDKSDQPREPWQLLDSTYSYRDQWLSVRSDTVLLPNGQKLSPYHVIELPQWVNVIAITDKGDILLVEQYRHAVQHTMFELPAGHVDPGETAEAAVKRELLEETGYEAKQWHDLGVLFPAVSRLNNKVRSYLALGAHRIREPHLDSTEDLRLHSMPWARFVEWLFSGDMRLRDSNQFASLLLLHMHASKSTDPTLAMFRL
jgi:ADP-ribose pyrophosphatase